MAAALQDLLTLRGDGIFLYSYAVLLVLNYFGYDCSAAKNKADIDNHLSLGKELLERGQLSDALTHFHAVVDGDPSDYLTLFKRSTVYLALGKTRLAIQDFSRVLELKPDFTEARTQRGLAYFKSGDYASAEADLEWAVQEGTASSHVHECYTRIGPAIAQSNEARILMDRNDHRNALHMFTQLIEISPWSKDFRMLRADCHIQLNDLHSAIADLRSVNKLTQDSTEGFYRISKLLYQTGDASSALKEIRECLKLDPEHKLCFPLYKSIRKIEKFLVEATSSSENKKYEDCISFAEKVLKNEKTEKMIMSEANRLLCKCYMRNEIYDKALASCNEALKTTEDAQTLCDRAEAYLGSEMYDDAIVDYQAALKLDESLGRAKEGLQHAKKLQKQSESRDYYKILNVKRTATKNEIVKAYRKAAQKWHPDNFQLNEEMKKVAEKKFIDIAAAKEVLTDPEKRKQFDAGTDPLDPESGHSHQSGFHGEHPFHFQQFHNAFRFHFN